MKSLICLTFSLLSISCVYSQKSNQKAAKPFFIAQGTYNKFANSSGTVGAATSLGVRFKETIGLAIHSQLITFGANKPYIPLALELSFLPEKLSPAPYVHLAIGKGIYYNKETYGIYTTSVSGGFFLSAGAGILIREYQGGGLLLTVSYVHGDFKYGPNLSSRIDTDYALRGFQFGLGFKI